MKSFLKGFYDRKGLLVSIALLFDKAIQLVAPIMIVKYVSKSDYGLFVYSLSVVGMLMPFSGFGLNHSLVFFGTKTENKQGLFTKFAKVGSRFNLIVAISVAGYVLLSSLYLGGSNPFLGYIVFYIITQYFHMLLNSFYRVTENNVAFARNSVIKSVLCLTLLFIFLPLLGVHGLIISYLLSPAVSVFRSIQFIFLTNKQVDLSRRHVKYGLGVGVAAIASQLILLSDNIIIGNLIEDSAQIATYKIATILPLGFFIIPNIFLTTDFVAISKMRDDKNAVLKYYLDYLKTFVIITVGLIVITYILAPKIILYLFGHEFADSIAILRILLIGTFSVFLFRNPLGFILNAIGQARVNVKVSYLTVLVNIPLSILLTQKYGIMGAAIGSVFSLYLGACFSLVYFIKWYRT